MEIKIQSIHFDATDKLEAFIEKKVAKLEKAQARYCPKQGGQHERCRTRNNTFRREDK